MTGTRTTWKSVGAVLVLGAAAVVVIGVCANPAHAVVKITDGFGDADRNNDGSTLADTDLNDSGTLNDATSDASLIARGITEVTAPTNPSDVGITWTATRAYDSGTNLVKSKLRIINDDVPHGVEVSPDVAFHHGLALGVESRGGGSSFIGKFGQSVAVGPVAGDKLVVSVDWRIWRESNDTTTQFPDLTGNQFKWGLWQDTDHELGNTAPNGSGFVSAPPGATVQWGKDDGNWFGQDTGAEGDKGIYSRFEFGSLAEKLNSRINWEYNSKDVGSSSDSSYKRFFQGGGVTNVAGTGGDVGVVAQPLAGDTNGNGTGGILGDTTSYAPHTLSMEFTRLANGLLNVKSLIDGVDVLHDDIKSTDTGYAFIGPPADSFDYVGFTNAVNDWDYAIDNFKVEVFGSNAGSIAGDYNGDNKVDAADYTVWRDTLGSMTDLRANGNTSGASATVIDIDDYNVWKANFGMGTGSGGGGIGGGTVPEPSSLVLLAIGVLLTIRSRSRRFSV